MANRNFANGGRIWSMNVMPILVDAKIVIGASGAVSSFSGSMVSSVTRVSQGIYQINMANNFASSLAIRGSMHSPSSGLSGIMAVEIQNNASSSVSSLSAPSLTVKTLDVTGALADPASGSTVDVLMFLNNSQVKA